MGFFSSSVGISRYRVTEPLSDGFWNTALEAVSRHLFVELEHSVKEVTFGWAPVTDPFRNELTLTDISFGNYLLLTMRVDERKVPAQVLKKYTLQEERRVMEEKGIKRLHRKARTELRDRVRQQLLARVLPVPKTYDVCMDISTGMVLFMSCQAKAQGLFENLFYSTFSIRLDPVVPFTLATNLVSDTKKMQKLNSLRPFTWG